uniref:SET domain-containing protein n=1 Tax=Panagrolaimus sp. ES5 TaxID=591445 RepID=A0AC34GNU2_9BILA
MILPRYDILPTNFLIVKEPLLRYDSPNKSTSIRIDTPSDIIFVDPSDYDFLDKIGATKWYEPEFKDAEVWREKANECFKKGDYKKAIFLYDRGIRCDPEFAVLYLNKTLACLRESAFYLAYESAKIGFEKGGDREKAFYRMGQAAYGMREWEKAINHLEDVLKEFPENENAKKELKRATDRLAEQKDGNFDLKAMFVESKKTKAQLDVADYKGPIEIANAIGKGRGIIASKDIQKGTLLVVSKSFASGYFQDFLGILMAINLAEKKIDTTAHTLQAIQTMQMLKNNPQRANEIYDMYAGDDMMEKEELPFGVIDATRIQQISSLNAFSPTTWDGVGVELDLNAMQADSHLFVLPSYFNHSCLANAHRTFYADVMVIHAVTDIKKSDEIYLSYISPLTDYPTRKKSFNKWNFTCECKLCKTDANDANYQKRSELFQRFLKHYSANKKFPERQIAEGERILQQVRETYAERQIYKLSLVQMLTLLAGSYSFVDIFECIKCLREAITLTEDEFKCDFKIAKVFYDLANCYNGIGNRGEAADCFKKAFEHSFCADYGHLKMLYDF